MGACDNLLHTVLMLSGVFDVAGWNAFDTLVGSCCLAAAVVDRNSRRWIDGFIRRVWSTRWCIMVRLIVVS